MTISENIFRLIKERNIKQKEFAKLTGISESTICDWKRKSTNPSSDKIMIICDVLGVSPYELLATCETDKFVQTDYIIVDKLSDEYEVVRIMRDNDVATKNRIIGYAEALDTTKSTVKSVTRKTEKNEANEKKTVVKKTAEKKTAKKIAVQKTPVKKKTTGKATVAKKNGKNK